MVIEKMIFQSPSKTSSNISNSQLAYRVLAFSQSAEEAILFLIFTPQIVFDDKIHAGIIKCSDKTTVVMTGIDPYQELFHAHPDSSGRFETTFDKFNRSF